MLCFQVFQNGEPAKYLDLTGAYAFGQDNIPVRAEIEFENGQVFISRRSTGACGLSLLWDSGGAGQFMLPTTRLPDRDEPYNLSVELVRGQLMRLSQKREDWGLFDYRDADELNERFDAVRREFVAALQAEDRPAEAAALADKALSDAVALGEEMAMFHAEIFLARRRASSVAVAKTGLGCTVDLPSNSDEFRARLLESFDFINVPMSWKALEPKEGQYRYEEVDTWVNWAVRSRKPMQAGPLLSFCEHHLPEWLYIWEHDYDTLRDIIYEHVNRTVKRYQNQVRLWKVVSGIHACNAFNLSFEQLMELTRMTCLLVKQISPSSQVLIDLVTPFGEYYARNQRTIPPMLYADMAVQSGIKFDVFGLEFHMGVPVDGMYVRDLMQISALLDEFVGFGKNLHVTACQVPSAADADAWDAWGGDLAIERAGRWRETWSPQLQAEWLAAFYRVVISKPFVDTVCWRDLADYEGHFIPHGGLFSAAMQPKPAYRELRNFRVYMATAPSEVIDQQQPRPGSLPPQA